ncbi:MAG TPA: lycopene cyclase [Polyangiaceae bacterium]|nr:lycopene cyclase [Polyangiaceae bacterium]
MNDVELARGRLREAPDGAEAIDRIEHLERSWGGRAPLERLPFDAPPGAPVDVDVAVAGGGLWLVLAAALARRGLRVAVLDRAPVGRAHREWNVSGKELAPFVASGLFRPAELESLVVARYARGVCRWHGGGAYPVQGVLDHAVDGRAFLEAVRAKALAAGARLLDRHELTGFGASGGGVLVRAREAGGGRVELRARVLVDALGAASPHARVDLGCPTVGAVLGGLREGEAADEVDPLTGDILATTEHRDEGRQHVWEGFPAGGGDYTTYLFHYARAAELGPAPLLSLYGRFFRLRPRYKRDGRGGAELRRLTFGIIPGWSRLGPAPAPPADGVLLVGDAAARHSPLTFCGFGSMARSFLPIAEGLARAIDEGDLSAARLGRLAPEPPLLRGVGALALLLAGPRRPRDPASTNRLLDAAFRALHARGNAFYASLLRDEMPLRDFVSFLYRTSKYRPEVYRDVGAYLGPGELWRWGRALTWGYLQG